MPHIALLAEAQLEVTSMAVLIGAGIATGVWALFIGLVRFVRTPANPEEAPPTMNLGTESPAVANLMTNDWKVTPDAVPGTLLDLAARGYVEFQQVQPGEFQCRLLRRDDEGLTPYERRVMILLRSKSAQGVVPTQALTTGPTDAAERWWKGFRKEVVAEAKSLGLSEDLWNAPSKTGVIVAAFVPAILFGIAIPVYGALYFAGAAAVATGALWGSGRQRATELGLSTASGWLGVKEHLRQDSVFDSLPPTAVITWERYLGYGAALGEAAGAARPIAMGAENDRRAWSSVGGRWRQVKVVYPGNIASPGWGRSPGAVLALSLVAGAAAYGLFYLAAHMDELIDTAPANAVRALNIAQVAAFGLSIVVAFAALAQFVRAAIDLFSKRDVVGQVIRARRYGSDDKPQFYLGVDDDTTDRIRAWRVRPQLYVRAPENGWVRATVTRNLRYVRDLQLVDAPAPTAPGFSA
jgi:hypothetical protein